jgi:hypothetical protein
MAKMKKCPWCSNKFADNDEFVCHVLEECAQKPELDEPIVGSGKKPDAAISKALPASQNIESDLHECPSSEKETVNGTSLISRKRKVNS